jgi:hypothetical protein
MRILIVITVLWIFALTGAAAAAADAAPAASTPMQKLRGEAAMTKFKPITTVLQEDLKGDTLFCAGSPIGTFTSGRFTVVQTSGCGSISDTDVRCKAKMTVKVSGKFVFANGDKGKVSSRNTNAVSSRTQITPAIEVEGSTFKVQSEVTLINLTENTTSTGFLLLQCKLNPATSNFDCIIDPDPPSALPCNNQIIPGR